MARHSSNNGIGELLTYISNLGLEDIDGLQSLHAEGGYMAADSMSDEDYAMLLFAQEAESLLNFSKDYTESSTQNRSLLDELLEREEMARYDHEVALAISEGRPIPPPPPPPPQRHPSPGPSHITVNLPEDEDEGGEVDLAEYELAVAYALSMGRPVPHPHEYPAAGPSHIVEVTPEVQTIDDELEHYFLDDRDSDSDSDTASLASSSGASSSSTIVSVTPPPAPKDCTVCAEKIEGAVIDAPCGHSYDIPCLQVMFQKASTDESLFPPRCCQISIEFSDIREHFDKDFASLYEEKSREFSTPDRVYCYQQTCSAFLGAAATYPSSILCPKCSQLTCGSCKQQAHSTRACSTRLDEQVLSLGKEQGWQRCHLCRHLVELNHGCHHITCICKAQFCYLCAAPWKTCACPQFAEERVIY